MFGRRCLRALPPTLAEPLECAISGALSLMEAKLRPSIALEMNTVEDRRICRLTHGAEYAPQDTKWTTTWPATAVSVARTRIRVLVPTVYDVVVDLSLLTQGAPALRVQRELFIRSLRTTTAYPALSEQLPTLLPRRVSTARLEPTALRCRLG
jgi:hypothetical protein